MLNDFKYLYSYLGLEPYEEKYRDVTYIKLKHNIYVWYSTEWVDSRSIWKENKNFYKFIINNCSVLKYRYKDVYDR